MIDAQFSPRCTDAVNVPHFKWVFGNHRTANATITANMVFPLSLIGFPKGMLQRMVSMVVNRIDQYQIFNRIIATVFVLVVNLKPVRNSPVMFLPNVSVQQNVLATYIDSGIAVATGKRDCMTIVGVLFSWHCASP